MPTEPWKYAENQFLSVTEDDDTLMGEIIADHLPRLAAATAADPEFDAVFTDTQALALLWNDEEINTANAEAGQKSATLAFTEKIDAIGRKPDADTNSPIETWDSTIRSQIPYQGTVYTYLLPFGREPLTAGAYEARLDALQGLSARLGEQSTKPVLLTLATTVLAYHTAALGLRNTQTTKKSALTTCRGIQEGRRIALCQQLHGNVGFALYIWRLTPLRIETLFDLTILRNPPQTIPPAPTDTLWTPGTHTLSTTALPSGATRIVAWRLAPGGAPEQLATGDFGATTVTIPETITFLPATQYQLWLQTRNAKGQSEPGPITTWTAP